VRLDGINLDFPSKKYLRGKGELSKVEYSLICIEDYCDTKYFIWDEVFKISLGAPLPPVHKKNIWEQQVRKNIPLRNNTSFYGEKNDKLNYGKSF